MRAVLTTLPHFSISLSAKGEMQKSAALMFHGAIYGCAL